MNYYFTPPTKKALLKSLLPTWKGKKQDLREMNIRRLWAIFHTERRRVEMGLVGR